MWRSTLRGAKGTSLPSWSKQSWMTWAVGSVAHGTMRTVVGSGRNCMSRSVGSITS